MNSGIAITISLCRWSTTAVARGAVLRALQKKDGPERRLQSSYGFSRHEPYGDYSEHVGQAPKRDGVDKQMYIWETIEWFLQKVGKHDCCFALSSTDCK